MDEIVTDVFTWAWFSEPHGYNFNGYLVCHTKGNLCIDPVPPSDESLADIARMEVAKSCLPIATIRGRPTSYAAAPAPGRSFTRTTPRIAQPGR